MKKPLNRFVLCAVSAIVIGICLLGAGQRRLSEEGVMFSEAMAPLAKEQTPEVWDYHYARLLAKGAEQEAWDKDAFECMKESFDYLAGCGLDPK